MTLDQRSFRPSPDEPVFIGFAGRMGSGKTSAAKFLSSKYQFQYRRYSQILLQWRGTSDQAPNQLQQIGWDVMGGGLQSELSARLIGSLDRARSAAIDGLRHRVDFDSLSSSFGSAFGLVFLEADEEVRYMRLIHRFASRAAFQAADSHSVESYIDDLRPLANLTVSNETSMENLERQLATWIANCGVRSQA